MVDGRRCILSVYVHWLKSNLCDTSFIVCIKSYSCMLIRCITWDYLNRLNNKINENRYVSSVKLVGRHCELIDQMFKSAMFYLLVVQIRSLHLLSSCCTTVCTCIDPSFYCGLKAFTSKFHICLYSVVFCIDAFQGSNFRPLDAWFLFVLMCSLLLQHYGL